MTENQNQIHYEIFFLSLFLIYGISLSAQVNDIQVQTDIDSATVFTNGALIHRNKTVTLRRGRNKLVFPRISSYINNKSIQFYGNKDLELLSITSKSNYLHVRNDPDIQKLKDSITFIEQKISAIANEQNSFTLELELLKKNMLIKGDKTNLTVQEIQSVSQYYRKRSFEIYKKISAFTLQKDELLKIKNRYSKQLNELNYKESSKSSDVVVVVDAPASGTYRIHLEYIVYRCGWAAFYDLSADNIKSGIELDYKAKVYNNTGNPWNDIYITLSTATPSQSASIPTLDPMFLQNSSYVGSNTYKKVKGNRYMVPQQSTNQSYDLSGIKKREKEKKQQIVIVKQRQIKVSLLSSEFKIESTYTIPSNAKPYIVEIKTYRLKGVFSHIAVPKANAHAFLLAKIGGWEKLNLVPGVINVYFSNNFVGQSFMEITQVEDSLGLSFGADNKVLVKRITKEEYTDEKVIGNNKESHFTYEILIKNNRSVPVKIDLYDQVPVSQNSDIIVTINEISNAKIKESTGELNWLVPLEPGEKKSFIISYSLKYPKNKNIRFKNKFRTISAPSF